MQRTRASARRAGRAALSFAVALGLGAACDGATPVQDPATPPSERAVAVSVRIDGAGDAASVSALAFHADAVAMTRDDVLGVVDPLLAPAPVAGCTLRAIDEQAARLRARDAWVELQSLGELTLRLDDGAGLRPAPRVFPDQSGIAAGIVDEVGPQALPGAPRRLQLAFDGGAVLQISLPELPRVYKAAVQAAGGATAWVPLLAGDGLPVDGELVLGLRAPPGAFIELRPFGTTEWLACAAEPLAVAAGAGPEPGDGVEGRMTSRVRLPVAALQRMARIARGVPVALDVVWRQQHWLALPADPGRAPADGRAHVVTELRASALVGLSR